MRKVRLINPNSPLTTITLPGVLRKMTMGRRALLMPLYDKNSLCWTKNTGEMALYVNGKVSRTYGTHGLFSSMWCGTGLLNQFVNLFLKKHHLESLTTGIVNGEKTEEGELR